MANQAKITIRVTSTRGKSAIQYSTGGRYVSFPTLGYQRDMTDQPIQPTSSLSAFWLSVLAAVQGNITANP